MRNDGFSRIYKKIKFGSSDENQVTDVYISDKETYYKEVDAHGLFYKIGMFVVLNIQKSEAEFGEVLKIWFHNELFFYSNEEVTFDHHYHGYNIEKSNKKILLKRDDLPNVAPVFSIKKNKTHDICTSYGL